MTDAIDCPPTIRCCESPRIWCVSAGGTALWLRQRKQRLQSDLITGASSPDRESPPRQSDDRLSPSPLSVANGVAPSRSSLSFPLSPLSRDERVSGSALQRRFLSCIELRGLTPLSSPGVISSFPSPRTVRRLADDYGILPDQLAAAAIRGIPVDFHLHACRLFIDKLHVPLQTLIEQYFSNTTTKHILGSLSQSVEALVELLTADFCRRGLFPGKVADLGTAEAAGAVAAEADETKENEPLGRVQPLETRSDQNVSKPPNHSLKEMRSEVQQAQLHKDICNAVENQLYIYFSHNWKRNYYFHTSTYGLQLLGRHTAEAYGRNVGALTGSYTFLDSCVDFVTRKEQKSNSEIAVDVKADARKVTSMNAAAEGVTTSLWTWLWGPRDENINDRMVTENAVNGENEQWASEALKDVDTSLTLDLLQAEEATKALDKYGLLVGRNVLSRAQASALTAAVHAQCPSSLLSAEALVKEDGNIYCHRSSPGRMQCIVRGCRLSGSNELCKSQRLWMPLVHLHLPVNNFCAPSDIPEAVSDVMKAAKQSPPDDTLLDCRIQHPETLRRVFVSETQLVTSDPLCLKEPWHRDTSNRGLTVVVPLAPMRDTTGAIEVISGSHKMAATSGRPWAERLRNFLECFDTLCRSDGTTRLCADVGDVIIMDSRLLRRILGNETWQKTPMLIFRYDYEHTPPPNQTLLQMRLATLSGCFFNGVSRIYKRL
eukprot:GHVT01080002.1.p1 GENE.GHVT01080002.1~~GHVT01080002.1.p1  ORF type:complete len:715 (+),score=67.44 GHVT01080002.1:1793-3937(+)